MITKSSDSIATRGTGLYASSCLADLRGAWGWLHCTRHKSRPRGFVAGLVCVDLLRTQGARRLLKSLVCCRSGGIGMRTQCTWTDLIFITRADAPPTWP